MNIRRLSSEELSHRFHECVKHRAELEGMYFSLDEHRKILLDKLTIEYSEDGTAHGKALSLARVSDEFKVHVDGQAVAKTELYQARGDVMECDFEIRRRLGNSFSKNREFSTGSLVT